MITLRGTVVTMDAAVGLLDDGVVYVDDAGVVAAVRSPAHPAPAGWARSPRVDVDGVLAPGFLELHTHAAYNWLGLWDPPEPSGYASRYEWPRSARYLTEVALPANVMGKAAGDALLRYVQLKALAGATTGVQGSFAVTGHDGRWLVRNVEAETFGGRVPRAVAAVAAITPDSAAVAARLAGRGVPFLCHLAEGHDPALAGEFDVLQDAGALAGSLVVIHGVALDEPRLRRLGASGGTLVWSPTSNLWLYAATADVTTARAAGVRLCLGSDWSPTGTKNLLGELKVADAWNRARLGSMLSVADLVRLVTSAPSDALGWSAYTGRIRPGAFADLVAFRRRAGDPLEAVTAAWERDVRLVLVGGRPRYGTHDLMSDCGERSLEAVAVPGATRFTPRRHRLATAAEELAAAARDPVAAYHRRPAGSVEVLPAVRLPGFDFGAPLPPLEVPMPAVDTLAHDDEFAVIVARSERGSVADGLLRRTFT